MDVICSQSLSKPRLISRHDLALACDGNVHPSNYKNGTLHVVLDIASAFLLMYALQHILQV